MASRKNSHCQPAQPCMPANAVMIQPDTGLPIMLASGRPIMNSAMILLRLCVGNQ